MLELLGTASLGIHLPTSVHGDHPTREELGEPLIVFFEPLTSHCLLLATASEAGVMDQVSFGRDMGQQVGDVAEIWLRGTNLAH